MWTPIIMAIVMFAWLPFYVWTEYHWKQRSYFWTKTISSLLFLSVAISAYLILRPNPDYALWVIAALIMGMIGDMLLVYINNLKCFVLGLVSFLIGQIFYGLVFLRFVGFSWIDVVVYVVVVGGALYAYTKTNLKLGKMKLPVLAYLLIISFMFVMAVSGIYKGGFSPLVTALIATGAALFLASDVVLGFLQFRKAPGKSLIAVNRLLYYVAQLILALTITAIA